MVITVCAITIIFSSFAESTQRYQELGPGGHSHHCGLFWGNSSQLPLKENVSLPLCSCGISFIPIMVLLTQP